MSITLTPTTSDNAYICTLDDIKDRLGISVTTHDTVLTQIRNAIQSRFERDCNRHLILNSSDVTEYYTGKGQYLQLARYPVVSITSIKEADFYDFTNATALTEDTDYRLTNNGKAGILYRPFVIWSASIDSIQVVYKGGYAGAGLTPGTGETALPDELREAAIMQSTFIWKRKDDIGIDSHGFDGGSISKNTKLALLPEVKQVLDTYKRLAV